jgi:imidazolonepropionase-like amidohydrolase
VSGVVLTAGLVLTGRGAITGGAVSVAGGVITGVGPADRVLAEVPAGTTRLDFPASTILPGLIDAHVHLAFDASDDPVAALSLVDDDELYAGMAERARRLLAVGVTTVRDLGDRGHLAIRLRDEIAAGLRPGPRILTAGTPVTTAGGHCGFLGGETRGHADIRRLARANLAAGADLLKIMVTGGHLTATGPRLWESQFGAEEIAIVVAEAHRAGRPVAAHAHGVEGIAAAVAAGVDTIEHCTFARTGGQAAGPDPRPELLEAMARQGIVVCPTVSGAFTEVAAKAGEAVLKPWLDLIRLELDHGIRVIAGTDAGVARARVDRYTEGLEWLARAGLTNTEILDMATTSAAEALGLGAETGRLAAGHRADLIVVPGDPRDDLAVLHNPQLTIAAGRLPRESDAQDRESDIQDPEFDVPATPGTGAGS